MIAIAPTPGAGTDAEIGVRIADKHAVSDTVVALHVSALDGAPLPAWQPGAHVDFILPNGLIRQYSLCGDPTERLHWRFGILREEDSRGGSAYIHAKLKKHDVLRLKGPRNRFPLIASHRYSFIAGGVGITPILPMVRAARSAGAEWTLVYGGRTRGSMAFVDELSALGDHVAVRPQDECGLLDLDRILAEVNPQTAVYCCGPEPLIHAVETRITNRPDCTLHVERFANLDTASSPNAPLSVRLARSGKTVDVRADESILEALERAGLKPAFSCREGACGTCETSVRAGRPDHRDVVLSTSEKEIGKTMMICVSRSLDPSLELDL